MTEIIDFEAVWRGVRDSYAEIKSDPDDSGFGDLYRRNAEVIATISVAFIKEAERAISHDIPTDESIQQLAALMSPGLFNVLRMADKEIRLPLLAQFCAALYQGYKQNESILDGDMSNTVAVPITKKVVPDA